MKLIKKFLIALVIIMGLIIALLLALFLILTHPERYKDQIVKEIHQQTGLQIEINGPIRWQLSPQLGISLNSVKSSQFSARRADVFLAVKPLLSGNIVVTKLILKQVSSTLVLRDGGSKGENRDSPPSFRAMGFAHAQDINPGSNFRPWAKITGDLELFLPSQHLVVDHLAIDNEFIHASGKIIGETVLKNPQLQIFLKLNYSFLKNLMVNLNYNSAQGFLGDLSAQHLQLNDLMFNQITAKIAVNFNEIRLSDIKGNVASGTFVGTLNITNFRQLPSYQLQANFSQVQLNQVFKSGILEGPADIDTQLTSSGFLREELLTNLKGNIKLNSIDGVLNNINLLEQIQGLHHFFLSNPEISPHIRMTHFSQLTASGIIDQGMFNNNDFMMLSPNLEAKGEGIINLLTDQINYQLLVKMVGKASDSKAGLQIPVKITGTLDKPKIKIDLRKIAISVP